MKRIKKFTFLAVESSVILLSALGWLVMSTSVYANCNGCLCPGNPCKLCPLPAMENVPLKPDESELCSRIREKVPPTSALPGSNEYFPNLDKSIMACVNEGGDVIRNRQQNSEFSARFYCKPASNANR